MKPENIYSISLPNDKQQQVKSLCSRKVLDDWNTHNAVLHFIHSYNMCLDTFASEILGSPSEAESCLCESHRSSKGQNLPGQFGSDSERFRRCESIDTGIPRFQAIFLSTSSSATKPKALSHRPSLRSCGHMVLPKAAFPNLLLNWVPLGSLADKRKYAPLGSDLASPCLSFRKWASKRHQDFIKHNVVIKGYLVILFWTSAM